MGVKSVSAVLVQRNFTTMKTLLKTFIFLLKQTLRALFLLWTAHPSFGQNLTQTIRGTALDKISQSPMQGAVVVLLNSNPLKGTTTDENGQFILRDVPVGKQAL